MKQIYEGIFTHPYIIRQGKQCYILENATLDDVNVLNIILNVAERMCICKETEFNIILPVFKEMYSLIGDADAEIKFIREQRN